MLSFFFRCSLRSPLAKQNQMEPSYCWSPGSPSELAELIRISLSGWKVIWWDYWCHPLRTRVDSTNPADWMCVLPLITESAPLSKLYLGTKCMWLLSASHVPHSSWSPPLGDCTSAHAYSVHSLRRAVCHWAGPHDLPLPVKYKWSG